MSVHTQHAQDRNDHSIPRQEGASDAVEQIKARLPIEDIVGETVNLKPASGGNFMGLCPFHGEKTPSFHVYAEGHYHCYSCKAHGSIFDFVMQTEHLEFREALEQLAARAGVELPKYGERGSGNRKRDIYDLNDLAQSYFTAQLKNHPQAAEYLQGRGFAAETVEAWGLGYAPDGWHNFTAHVRTRGIELEALEQAGLAGKGDRGFYDLFRGRVTIPIRDDFGRIAGFSARTLKDEQPKYVNTPATAAFKKGEVLFGFNKAKSAIKDKSAAILAEGQFDVVALHQAGFTAAVGLQTSSLTEPQIKRLERYGATLYSALDDDKAGQEATLRLLNSVQRRLNVRVVTLAGKDPAEMVQADPESFAVALEAARTEAEWRYSNALQDIDPRTPEGRDKFLESLKPGLSDMGQPGSGHELRELAVATIGADVTTRDLKIFADGKEGTLDASREREEDAELHKQHIQERVKGEVEPFPLEVLPPSLRAYVEACATALPVPPDFIAVPMLVTAATAIGHSRKIVIKKSWHEGARLWAAIVANPGSRKSAALGKALDPLHAAQNAFKKEYVTDLETHKAQLQQYEAEKAGRKKGDSLPDHPGDAPEMRQNMTTNATFEAIEALHGKNPRGLVFYQDELSGWVKGMDQYKGGKGSDRQNWLSSWTGIPTINNRKNQLAGMIPDPYINVVGSIQPDVLPTLKTEQVADGFVDRILFSYPKPISSKTGFRFDDDVSDEVVAGYRRVIDTLSNLEQVETVDGFQPKPLQMTTAAKEIFTEWIDEHTARLEAPELDNQLRDVYGKMSGYCARFALILHLLAYANGVEPDETISEASVKKAGALAEYFMSHAERVHKQLTDSKEEKILKAVYDYIDRQPQRRCTPRDLVHAKVPGCVSAKATKTLLEKLTGGDLGQLETIKRPSGQKSEVFVLSEKLEGVG